MSHWLRRWKHVPRARARTVTRVVLLLAIVPALGLHASIVQGSGRTGKEVVDTVCAACHGTGLQGAPRIGDKKAWAERAALGLSSLTRHALQGIRQMPAHGGKPALTDLEIGRAIAYMVNQSGGKWVEPASERDLTAERSGSYVVATQCAKCHETGVGGAPRIGDRGAWIPRLALGFDHLVRSAIRGHGGMPPRGGLANLTDSEVRAAVVYMYNPGVAVAPATRVAPGDEPPARPDPYHRTVGGMDIYLGFMPAERLRAYPQGSVERTMHGGVPRGRDYYHVNVSLLDHARRTPIKGAQIDLRVEEPGLTSETRKLEPMTIGTPSYGNYFRMKAHTHYVLTVRVRTPGAPHATEARFEHWHD